MVRNWGRIDTNGQGLVEVFASEEEEGQALEAVTRAKRWRTTRISNAPSVLGNSAYTSAFSLDALIGRRHEGENDVDGKGD